MFVCVWLCLLVANRFLQKTFCLPTLLCIKKDHIWKSVTFPYFQHETLFYVTFPFMSPYPGVGREFSILIMILLSVLHIGFHSSATLFFSSMVIWSPIPNFDHLSQSFINFCKGPDNILDFMGRILSVIITQLCHCSTRTAINSMYLLTLKFEFTLIFMSQIFFWVFQLFKV